MAAPTETELQTMIANAVNVEQHFREYLSINADNFITDENTLITSLETEYADQVTSGLAGVRAGLSGAASRGAGRSMVDPLLREYARTILNTTETDGTAIMRRLYDHFIDNSLTVSSRVFAFGTAAAGGGNTGDGVLSRINTDDENFSIENQTPDAKVSNCISDRFSGRPIHQEQFEIFGEAAERDALRVTGSGKSGIINALSANDSANFISNPSFSEFSGPIAAPTAIVNWTPLNAIGNFELDQTTIYRSFDGDATPTAVKYKANDKLSQAFSVLNANFNPAIPIYVQIAFNRSTGGADGTLTLRWGSQSASVALVAQSGYQVLQLGLGDEA